METPVEPVPVVEAPAEEPPVAEAPIVEEPEQVIHQTVGSVPIAEPEEIIASAVGRSAKDNVCVGCRDAGRPCRRCFG